MQAQAYLAWLAGEHGVHRAKEVAQIVGGGDQAASGQVELALGYQTGQLWGQGEAADAHGHHQCHGTGQQLYEGRHGKSPARRDAMDGRVGRIDFQ